MRYMLVMSEWSDWYVIPVDKLAEFRDFEKENLTDEFDIAIYPSWVKEYDLGKLTFTDPK